MMCTSSAHIRKSIGDSAAFVAGLWSLAALLLPWEKTKDRCWWSACRLSEDLFKTCESSVYMNKTKSPKEMKFSGEKINEQN